MKESFGVSSGIFQRFQGFFSEILSSLSVASGLRLAFQTKIQLCVLPKMGKNIHFRSGVVFTP